MKTPPAFLAAAALLAGCGGSTASAPNRVGLAPGYYRGTADFTPTNTATTTFETRTYVAATGAIRVFALGPTAGASPLRGRRVALSSLPGTTNPDGSTVSAALDGVPSSGVFTLGAEPPTALDFAGSAFRLATTAEAATLPALTADRTLAPGTYFGEVVALDARGDVSDWGDATGVLAVAADGSATLRGRTFPAAGTPGPYAASLAPDGTGTAPGTTGVAWSGEGGSLLVRFTTSNGALLLNLAKR